MATILFIDDDPSSLSILGKATEILGHQAVLVDNAGTAVEVARREHPDIIMIDLMMPLVDGWSVLHELKSNQEIAPIPTIILSAGSQIGESDRAVQSGAQAYLSKPVSLNSLKETIDQFTTPH